MPQDPVLGHVDLGRLGFRFTPEVVRALIPPRTIGTYLLLRDHTPVYIGRSDFCLRARLSQHPLLSVVTHFVWEPQPTSFHAFCLEALWYHRLAGQPGVLNAIHPARPEEIERGCPFCELRDIDALRRALGFA